MGQAFQPYGIVTLTTDFGQQGPFVGVMKGRILGRHPAAHIIDITHDVPPYWHAEAGFWLARSWEYFPAGSVHVAVVDPGVGTSRDILVVAGSGHVFLAPDNGLLSAVIARLPQYELLRVTPAPLQKFGLGTPSATFHGRDIFAPLAAELAAGRCQPHELGSPCSDFVPSPVNAPRLRNESVEGTVIALDRFGNLITDIDRGLLSGFKRPVVSTGGRSLELRRTYGDAKPGECLALINSFETIEIACSEGNAAQMLGLGRGAPVRVTDG